MAEFLLELLSEEIPARMQARAADDLERLVCQGLEKAGLRHGGADAFVTPRRLALVVDDLPERQPDVREERKGPRVGSPAKAIEGFLRAAGLASLDQAEVRESDKGRFYFATSEKAGRPTAEVLAGIVGEMIAALPWPKSMRWADTQLTWVRPLAGILAIFAGAPVPFCLSLNGREPRNGAQRLALQATRETVGHRFLAPASFGVTDFADYRSKLRAAKVILDQVERRRLIATEAARLAGVEQLRVRDDPALLDEVTGLVEWPVVHLGRIDQAFMDVPAEVLITAMRTHQKYFALTHADGTLAPRFVVVANTETVDCGAAVVAGNERVLRARLSDAKYFWDQDRKRTLESRVPKLAERVFYKDCSDLERTQRLVKIAPSLAQSVKADPVLAERAARLCKADLLTQMVGEFPELQGIMGRYYALHDGEPASVADAIRDHYAPQGPNDRCPTAPVSVAVALAEKLDTLVFMFSTGERPTGSKDPFGLRRAALGAIRLIVENSLRISLLDQFDSVANIRDNLQDERPVQSSTGILSIVARSSGFASAVKFGKNHRTNSWALLDFFADRLKVHLREQGVRHDLIAAAFAGGGEDDIVRLLARVDALRDFLDTDDGANLLTAYRRASNIVRIEEAKDGAGYEGEADPRLLSEQREVELHQALGEARGRIAEALSHEQFGDAMAILAGLRSPVDAFFDHVQVNCQDPHLRANRLRLLAQIRSALGGVADFSQIEG